MAENYINEALMRRRLRGAFPEPDFPQVPDFVPPPEPPASVSKFREVLASQPQLSEYKPSTFRNVMSRIAGGGIGATQGARAGMEAQKGVYYAPFEKQMSAYRQQLGTAGTNLTLDQKLEEARQKGLLNEARVGRLGTQSEADILKGEADVSLRKMREKQVGALPGSFEEDIVGKERVRKAGIRPSTPVPPRTALDTRRGIAVTTDPGGEVRTKTYGEPIKTADPEALARLRHQLRMNEIRFLEAGRNKRAKGEPPPKGPSVASQTSAEKLAIQYLLQQNPQYKSMIDQKTGKILPFEEGFFESIFGGGVESKKKYDTFLAEKDRLRDEILSKAEPKKYRLSEFNEEEEEEEDPYEMEEEEE